MALAASGAQAAAIAALQRAIERDPTHVRAWRSLGDRLLLAGDHAAARTAYAYGLRAGVSDALLAPAASALCQGRFDQAETALKAHIRRQPYHTDALHLLAEAAYRLGHVVESEAVLDQCLQIAPGARPARHSLAILFYTQNRWAQAVPHFRQLLRDDAHEPNLREFLAWSLARLGDFAAALPIFEAMLADYRDRPTIWLQYGHALKTIGRTQDAVAAYRTCIELAPDTVGAYISLADIKTFRFAEAECAAMRALLSDAAMSADRKAPLHYALGRACEQDGAFEAAFTHFAAGASCRRSVVRYEPAAITDLVERTRAVFTPALLARLAPPAPAKGATCPIFVVGLPRSGSTLVEQILASHSTVEATMELTEMAAIAGILSRLPGRPGFPEILAELESAELAHLGGLYVKNTKGFRKTARPCFVDKTPGNWMYAGLIHLILPDAKIIDIRREPMAAGFAAYKHYFAEGHEFSYDLEDVARYYNDYSDLMAHFDAVLPGRVHHVQYESLVVNTETEISRLLDYCGLPLEPACLRFWETEREIRTPSAEQVRQPIYKDALHHWRHFEPWLSPLRQVGSSFFCKKVASLPRQVAL
jgi:tetratricopeptide (TPR) repeat protein